MSNLLALDQASHVSGYAIFTNGELVKYGKISADHDDLGERLVYIRDQVESLIDKYKIDEIVFEDIQLQGNVSNNVKTFKILAEVFGVLDALFFEKNLPRTAILSASWKSGLGIRGKNRAEQKRNAQAFVTSTYNIKATQDESDAICIGTFKLSNPREGIKITNGGFDWSN